MKISPVNIGERTEGIVLSEFLRAGFRVLLPFGYNHRYDLAVDIDGRFIRIQAKTGRIVKNGTIEFNSCSVDNVTHIHRPYFGEADWFAVHCHGNNKTYLVPVDEIGARAGSLRLDATRNGQSKKVRMAEDYEFSVKAATLGEWRNSDR